MKGYRESKPCWQRTWDEFFNPSIAAKTGQSIDFKCVLNTGGQFDPAFTENLEKK